MRGKKILTAMLVISLVLTAAMTGNSNMAAAAASAIEITEGNLEFIVKPGEESTISIPVKAIGTYIDKPTVKVSADNAPFTFTNPKLKVNNIEVNGISSSSTTYVEFNVRVKESAKIRDYPIRLSFTYIDWQSSGQPTTSYVDTYLSILEEKAPAQLTVSNIELKNFYIGNDTDLSFVIKNEGELMARNVYFSVDYGSSGIAKKYSAKEIKVGDLLPGAQEKVTLPVSILSSAEAGNQSLDINFKFKTVDGDPIQETYGIIVNLKKKEYSPNLQFDNISYIGDLKVGNEFTVVATITNQGFSKAKDINVSIDSSSIGVSSFLTNYFTDGIEVSNLNEDETIQVEIPLIVSKEATSGLKNLNVIVNYKDEAGGTYENNQNVWLDIIGEVVSTDEPNLIIDNVKQSPEKPKAGDKLEVSFDIENKSKVDVSEIKISLSNLTGDTFIPVNSDPYIYIEKLEAGKTTRITIPLNVSENVPHGLNNLTVNISYAGQMSETINIPIRNVQNVKKEEAEDTISRPKLIISNYVTDVEELRAGSVFNFTFDIYNTNATVAAKNITVTVTQPENIFSTTQGSNSFYINKIAPGETVQKTLEMKVKNDATTKTYPLKVTFEYEYDGAEINPATGEIGEMKEVELNLQAVENSRPVVDYAYVYSWDGMVTIGNTAILSFEFFNMGKSPLNNVIATVEGDFVKADGDMHYIGNVSPGSAEYVEFDVIPNMEGMAKCILKITFEDSNGDEVEYIKEFEQMVNSPMVWDPGMDQGGYEDVFNPSMPETKKEILPLWMFITIQVAIFILFIPITRKIIISIYRSKLRKQEELNY